MNIRPCFVEINLNAITHNYNVIKELSKKDIIGVVKANAYGHGAIEVSKNLINNGAIMLAVATVEEALELREFFGEIPILILGPVPDYQKKDCIINNISFIASTVHEIKFISSIAKSVNKNALIHIALDTGMSRVGYFAHSPNKSSIEDILKMLDTEFISFEGIFTHFASADESDLTFMYKQYSAFEYIVSQLQSRGFEFKYIHCQNSAASMVLSSDICNCVRAGIALYGYYPSSDIKANATLLPALSWKCRISYIKDVPANTPIGYGSTYITDTRRKIATLPVGYADGLRRSLSNNFEVICNNCLVPVVGRICMDQCMIDVSGIDCEIGDEVYLINNTQTAEKMAKIDDTISYEILCGISARVPRTYVK